MRLISIAAIALMGICASAVLAPSAWAETLSFTCTAPTGSRVQRIIIDLGTGLISNDLGGSGRRWAAKVTDANISWDEVFDLRNDHTANHYILDRSTGTLNRTNMARAGSVPDTLNVVCHTAP